MKKVLVALLVVMAIVATMALAACKPAETKGDSTSTPASTTTSTAASTVESTPASTPAESTSAAESTQAPASEENSKAEQSGETSKADETSGAEQTSTGTGENGTGTTSADIAEGTYKVFGSFDGYTFETGRYHDMTDNGDGTFTTGPITMVVGDEFEVRGANGFVIGHQTVTETYTDNKIVKYDTATGAVTIEDFAGFSK